MLLTVISTNLRKCESLDTVIAGVGLKDYGLGSYAILDREAVGASFRQWLDDCVDNPAVVVGRSESGSDAALTPADEFAARLDVDCTPPDEYRETDAFLEDLSCCAPEMCYC